jgi:hypothetical protein
MLSEPVASLFGKIDSTLYYSVLRSLARASVAVLKEYFLSLKLMLKKAQEGSLNLENPTLLSSKENKRCLFDPAYYIHKKKEDIQHHGRRLRLLIVGE